MDIEKFRIWLAIAEYRLRLKSSEALMNIYEKQLPELILNDASPAQWQMVAHEELRLMHAFFRSIHEEVKTEIEYAFEIGGLPLNRPFILWRNVQAKVQSPNYKKLNPADFSTYEPGTKERKDNPSNPQKPERKLPKNTAKDVAGVSGFGLVLGSLFAFAKGKPAKGAAMLAGGGAMLAGSWGADYALNNNKPFNSLRQAHFKTGMTPDSQTQRQVAWRDVLISHCNDNTRIFNDWIDSVISAASNIGEAY